MFMSFFSLGLEMVKRGQKPKQMSRRPIFVKILKVYIQLIWLDLSDFQSLKHINTNKLVHVCLYEYVNSLI